nr:ATP-binding protein [Sphingomonas kyeonggiensis]
MLDAAKISVASDCEVAIVLADRIELQQVLVNLIRNALRANRRSARSRGHVHISIQTRGGPEVAISVSDQGGGLPPGQETRVFDPLFSTDPSEMGLGLAISRTILRDLGGEMIAHNNPEGGATFNFTLPLRRHL